ncbi:CHAT domain-containing protein [Mycena maculata]|uniref:CHAT domain-containing protein n=1 Tax=Mycena maculata TaxID=230809 RepID=A0AAD7MZ63_9AGAR|nr:CHAT domain-containing protein [Mycena maculata]
MHYTIHLHDIEIKSLSGPHDDLPGDMQISAQLIVDNHLFLQTVPQDSWKFKIDCKIPEWALSFWFAIIRHSKTRGTRLLGHTGLTTRETLTDGENQTSSWLDLVNVNVDGPTLEWMGNLSVSESLFSQADNEMESTGVRGSLQALAQDLKQLNDDTNNEHHLMPWVIHEKILFLSSTTGHRGRLLNYLGDICLKHWETSHMMDCLNEAVYAYEDAVRDHPKEATYLHDLGHALYYRFQQHGQVDDIHKAVLLQKDVLHLIADDDSRMVGIASDLASFLQVRFERFGDLSDLNQSISIREDAVLRTPEGHPDRPGMLSNLGISLLIRFEQLGDVCDVSDCISRQRDAVRLTPDGDPGKATTLSNLGSSLLRRFERGGDLSDINEAISKQEAAVQLIPEGSLDKPAMLNGLGTSLACRYKRLGNLNDLNESISHLKDVVRLTPAGHPGNPGWLQNLGSCLKSRFEQFGDLRDLNECITMQEDAVQLTSDNHLSKPSMLNSLGNSLLYRFMQLGDIDDVNECITKQEHAVHLTPSSHPARSVLLNNLGSSLLCRFERLGDLSDLNECILMEEDALGLTPDGDPGRPTRLSNLGNSLLRRFERLGDVNDINESISKQEDAVRLTSDDHPDKPSWLNNLGLSLGSRFEQLGDMSDIDNCISKQETAIQLIPAGSPHKPSMLNNLGNSLARRYERLGNLSDLNESISKHKDVVHLTPDGHSVKPSGFLSLGHSLRYRYEQLGDPNDFQETIGHYTTAACSTTGPAHVRFHAAKMWTYCAQKVQHPSLLEACQIALDLLPEVAWLGLSISDRHHQIVTAGSLVREAAAAAVACGQPEMAVEWLEQGRSIIWGQFLNLRTPVDALKQKWPEIASQLISLSAQLDGATTRNNNIPFIDSMAQQSLRAIAHQAHKNSHERGVLLQKIRQLPGFHQFLLPKTISQLSLAAQKGPVVILTGLTEEVLHVSLHEFTPESVNSLVQSFKDLIPSTGRSNIDRLYGHREGSALDKGNEFARILSELWVRLVKPVLDALAITTPTEDNLSRIWWCPTGPLTFLPIHAAGIYGNNVPFGSKLSDFVISSYTPSLAALIQGVCPTSQSQHKFQLLAVAQASSVGQSYIPGTKDEIALIQQCARGKVVVCPLLDHQTTIGNVEEGMMESNCVHFACHGVQDGSTPTQSALLLAGSSRLTLERIIKLSLPHADLAFLSACQTATGDRELQDESVHLAAGMLLAGYRGVIATMWSIMDNDAPQVAGDVYEHLFKTSPPDTTQAAEALHLAIRNLRARCGDTSFFCWVPFIHVGV